MAHLSVSAVQLFGPSRQLVVVDHSHVSSPRGVLSLLPENSLTGVGSSLVTVHKLLCSVIDSLGQASANAQGLPSVITSATKLASSIDQRIYTLIDVNADRVVGILKVGRKRLFLSDPRRGGSDGVNESMLECMPLSILDFYVVEGSQRRGYGRRLCDAMLSAEGVHIGHTAIDRPSPKMLSFLARHYGLTKPFSQRNHFTIYDAFFQSNNPALARLSSGIRRDLRKSFSSDCIPGSRSAYAYENAQMKFVQPKNQPDKTDPNPLMPQIPRPLLPSISPYNNRPTDSRERHAQPMSADVLMKTKYQHPPQQQHQLAFNNAQRQGISDPPLLARDAAPESYRQLFSAVTTDGFPRLYPRGVAEDIYGNTEGMSVSRNTNIYREASAVGSQKQDIRLGNFVSRQGNPVMQGSPFGRTAYSGGSVPFGMANRSQRPPFYRPF